MNEESMTMGLVSKSKKKRTYTYNAFYKGHDGKWNFYSSATIPNTDIDTVRKKAIARELGTWPGKARIVVYDDKGKQLGQIVTTPYGGYPQWETEDKVYNLSSNTGKISPLTLRRRV